MKSCPRCEGTIDLPHPSDEDCFRALDREISGAVRLLRTLTKRKGKLLRVRIRARQRAISHNASQPRNTQKMLAGAIGPRGRRPSLLASRRFSRRK